MKKKSKFEKVLLGFVIWSAVAWAVWAASKTKKWKEIKEKLSNKIQETSKDIKNIIFKKTAKKETIWHKLNKVFFK